MSNKTKKAVVKRIKFTNRGKLVRRKMGVNHFRAKKTEKQRINVKKTASLVSADAKAVKNYLYVAS